MGRIWRCNDPAHGDYILYCFAKSSNLCVDSDLPFTDNGGEVSGSLAEGNEPF